MEEQPKPIKEYAGGWITEREGTEVPGFLKLAFLVIGGSCLAYLLLFMNGETGNAERGPLVQQLNAATGNSAALMYAVWAMMLAFAVIVVLFAVRRSHEK